MRTPTHNEPLEQWKPPTAQQRLRKTVCRMVSVRKTLQNSDHQASTKQLRLRLVYVDFWSAMKLAFIVGLAAAAITMISSLGVFAAVSAAGYISDAEDFLFQLSGGRALLAEFVNLPQVLAFSGVATTLNLVLVTVLGAVIAGIHNRANDVANGLSVGFAPDLSRRGD